MRLRWTGIPLPGPFRLTPGRSRGGSGCAPLIGLALVIGFAIEYPWLLAVAAGIIAAAALVSWYSRRHRG